MTRLALAIALVGGVVLCRSLLAMRAARPTEPDPMQAPFLDSRNSATYLYNPTTRVVTSYN